MKLFEGRVALVTGAASGIGRASARRFSAGGARVAVADVDMEGAAETVSLIEEAGGEAFAVRADVTDEAAVEAMVARTVERYGRLDAAHNNAGISDGFRKLHEFPLDAWERMLTGNLTSVFLCLKYEVKAMLEQEPEDFFRAAIVNTSSGAGLIPAPGQPHYTAAKHGVIGLTRWVAQAYSKQGIRCNAILPGLVDTKMLGESLPAAIREGLQHSMPGGELGRPDDQASAAVWLCSREARFVNGQSLVVDGGGILH